MADTLPCPEVVRAVEVPTHASPALISRMIDRINVICAFLSGICLLLITVFVTYDVVARYFFNAPTKWVLESSIYLCLASVFLGGGYVLQKDNHILVDVLVNVLPARTRIQLASITSILSFSYCFLLFWQGGKIALGSLWQGEVSPTALQFPMFIPRGMVCVGGGLLCLQFIDRFVRYARELASTPPAVGSSLQVRLVPLIFMAILVGATGLLLSKGLSLAGIVIVLFVLLFSGMPVGFAMGFLGMVGYFFLFGGFSSFVQAPLIAYKNLDDFVIVSVPLFMMTSIILMVGKIGSDLFETVSGWTRHLPGGLEASAILACAVFAAISGSSAATVMTIGTVALPEMIRRGCRKEHVYGALAVGGVLGPIIPPSLHMILIGAITGESIGRLFMAGMLPGIMLAIMFAVYFLIVCRKDKDRVQLPKMPLRKRFETMKKAFWGLLTPVIILGGIYTGVFTPTEAAGVSGAYGLLVCILFYRTIKWSELKTILMKSAETSSMVLFIIVGAMTFGQLIALLQVPNRIVGYLQVLSVSPMVVLCLILVVILVLGALMDEASILLITYPILYEIFVNHYHFDHIWFAMVFIMTLEVGLVAPPVGLNLFVVQGIEKGIRFKDVVKGVFPLILIMLVAIVIIILVKPLSTWLPSMMG
jgi:C4-dicarboxylate transporter, DctM subunit